MPYRSIDDLFAIGQGECVRMTLLLLLTLAPAAALSNPLPLGGPGRTVVPFMSKSSSIRLMEEHVSIKVGETREVPGFAPNPTMKTRCVSFTCAFSLRNSGPARTLQVGFPFFSGRTSAGEGCGEVDDFRVSIDGRQAGPIKEQRRPMKEIVRCSGTQFDPGIVDIVFLDTNWTGMSSGRQGIRRAVQTPLSLNGAISSRRRTYSCGSGTTRTERYFFRLYFRLRLMV